MAECKMLNFILYVQKSLTFAAEITKMNYPMRKTYLSCALALMVSIPTFAGGYLTNTNQHVSFLRMVARGASVGSVDGVYYNPAGLTFLPTDGFHLSVNGQSAYQTRNIAMTFPLFPEEGQKRTYQGKASAPFIPSLQLAYKKGDWVLSGSFAVVGGGGKASFSNGVGQFDALAMGGIAKNPTIQALQQRLGKSKATDLYDLNSSMSGSQFIYGAQLGVSYRINNWLSAFAGGRMNYFHGGYEGFLSAKLKNEIPGVGGNELAALELDCKQTGWGITPIVGVNVKWNKWNLGVKYEFLTNLNLENKTVKSEFRQGGQGVEGTANPLNDYRDGVNTPSDIPALFTAAVGYEILPSLRASVEYHHFFDKQAGMAKDKQKVLKHGTHEYLAGVEWDVNKRFTLSAGYQRTNYGLSDDFQSDISFSCDSYSIGLGGKVNLNERLALNVAYFWTNYDPYTVQKTKYTTVYDRTNKVFGLGVDYRF